MYQMLYAVKNDFIIYNVIYINGHTKQYRMVFWQTKRRNK